MRPGCDGPKSAPRAALRVAARGRGTAVVVAAILATYGSAARAEPPARSAVQPLEYGTAWYPEQWPESTWDADLTLMHDGGFTFVRIAEFAWSTIEPQEGHFHWDWLDHAIAYAAAHGLRVVVGTPTAAPPAWLSAKYPEILAVEANGARARHGGRRQFSVGSALSARRRARLP